jgi:hypothetical protein
MKMFAEFALCSPYVATLSVLNFDKKGDEMVQKYFSARKASFLRQPSTPSSQPLMTFPVSAFLCRRKGKVVFESRSMLMMINCKSNHAKMDGKK